MNKPISDFWWAVMTVVFLTIIFGIVGFFEAQNSGQISPALGSLCGSVMGFVGGLVICLLDILSGGSLAQKPPKEE